MKFKELNTGLVYEFTQAVDIASMLIHSEYEQVVEVVVKEVKVVVKPTKE